MTVGVRPCLPDMKPVIGPALKHDNSWFAFGRGHQGLPLGPVTGRFIEENQKSLGSKILRKMRLDFYCQGIPLKFIKFMFTEQKR